MMFCCQMLVLPYKWCWCCLSNIISEWPLSKLDLNQLLSATKYISKYDYLFADLSRVGCHCNAAAYFIQMPGYNSGQSPEPGEGGDYYCDANKVGGNYCPEYDNFEGNKYTMASTLHTCNYIPPNFYDWCDGGGCQTNAFNAVPNMMCPEGKIFKFKNWTSVSLK